MREMNSSDNRGGKEEEEGEMEAERGVKTTKRLYLCKFVNFPMYLVWK